MLGLRWDRETYGSGRMHSSIVTLQRGFSVLDRVSYTDSSDSYLLILLPKLTSLARQYPTWPFHAAYLLRTDDLYVETTPKTMRTSLWRIAVRVKGLSTRHTQSSRFELEDWFPCRWAVH